MSSKKQSETNEHPNLNFLIKFVSTNYQRREVDEETCTLFNYFLTNYIEYITKDLPLVELKTLIKIVSSVFLNFEELNKNKPSFQFFIQLFGLTFNLLDKLVSLKIDKSFYFEVLEVFEYVFDVTKKETSLAEMEKNIQKMTIPKNLKEIESIPKGKNRTFGRPLSTQKYNEINSLVCRYFENGNLLLYYLKGFLNVEGQNYLDILLELIVITISDGKSEEFKKILKVYKFIGESNNIEINNISFLVNKIIRSKKKVQFFYILTETISLQKFYPPNYLFAVCLNILDAIFEQCSLTNTDYESIKTILKFKYAFKSVDDITEKIKLINLPFKILKCLIRGKVHLQNEGKKKKKEHKKTNSETLKSSIGSMIKSIERPKAEDLQIMDEDEEKQKILLEMFAKNQELEVEKEEIVEEKEKQAEEGEGIPLKKEEMQKYSKAMKQLFSCFLSNESLVKVLKQCNREKIFELLAEKNENYNKKMVEFIVEILPTFMNIKLEEMKLDSPLVQVLALRVVEKQFSKKEINQQNLMGLYKKMHNNLLNEETSLNYQFVICHILHHSIGDPKVIINYLLQNSRENLNFENLNKLSLNLSLLVSCLEPVANLRFTTQHLISNIDKLNAKFNLDDYFYDEEKENKLFINRGSYDEEEDEEQKYIYENLSEIVSKANRLIDINIDPINLSLNSFYKVIIELNILCKEKGRDKFSQSKMLSALKKMRNSNKLSMFLTLNRQLCSQVKDYLQFSTEDLSQMIVILHLIKKGQLLMASLKKQNNNKSQNNANNGSSNENNSEGNNANSNANDEDKNKENEEEYIDQKQLCEGRELLVQYMIKIGDRPSKKLIELVNENFDNEKKETDHKNQVLALMIKDFRMIKFYSQMMKSKEFLQLLSLKLGLKMIKEMEKLNKQEKEMRDEGIERKIKKLTLIYSNENENLNEKERKMSQMYTKIKILTSNQENTSIEHIKSIVQMLQSNHEGLQQILIREQEENKESEDWYFEEKTGLMGYLLQTMVNNLKGKSQVSILLLNMLKTIIDNSSNILKITQHEMLKKLKDKNVTNLIIQRTGHGVQMIKRNEKNKQIQEYLQQSKKMYSIIGKVINLQQISILTLLQKIIQFDTVENSQVSLYILRELINIGIIVKSLNVNEEQEISLTEIIFAHLMKLKQTYHNQFIPHPTNTQEKLLTSSIITYFIYQFYSLSDNNTINHIFTTNAKNTPMLCLLNRKTSSFRCLSCDEELQICMNCAIQCHSGHPIVHNIGNYQISKYCQCRETSVCKLAPQNKKAPKKISGNPFSQSYGGGGEDFDSFKKNIFKLKAENLERERDREKGKLQRKLLGLYDDDQSFEMIADPSEEDMFEFGGGGSYKGRLPPFGFPPMGGNNSGGSSSNNWKMPNKVDEYIRAKNRYEPREEREPPLRYEGRGGLNPFSKIPNQKNQLHDIQYQRQERQREDDEGEIVFDEEEYEKLLKSENLISDLAQGKSSLASQSYLLPIFMNIATQICEIKQNNDDLKKDEVIYHIKLQQPPTMNNKIAAAVLKMCQPGSFPTKIRKPDSGAPTSPNISRKSFAFNEKFVAIVAGLNLNIHLKEKLYSFIAQNKNSNSGFPWVYQNPLQYEGHSVGFAPHKSNLLCVAGIHNLSLYEVQNDGNINRHPTNKFGSNNDNINKIHMTKLGIFVGFSKQIKLMSYSLKQVLSIQSPSLIKQWNIYNKQNNEYVVYVVLPDGFIYYAQIAPWTDGLINLNKKLTDSRLNRPVGSFVMVKDIKDCGTLIHSNYKDKNIGHTFGRLQGNVVQDINYLKFINQGLNNSFDRDHVMGLTDVVENPNNPKQLYIVVNMIPQLPDILSIHRGILTLIKVRLQQNGNSKYEVQILSTESRCEYFEIVRMGEKAIFIMSLHEDGSLLITTPSKIAKNYCENEIKEIKDKKLKNELMRKPGNEEQGESDKVEKLRNIIKETINIKSIKSVFEKVSPPLYSFVEHSQILKSKQDFTVIEMSKNNNITTYEIRYNSFNKIITGISLPIYGSVQILTRNIKNTLQFGLSIEESLYFYAFGRIRLEFTKNEEEKYTRNAIDNMKYLKKKRGDPNIPNIQELIKYEKYEGRQGRLGQKVNNNELILYGQSFDNFKAKINKFEQKFTDKVFNLTNDQIICNSVKVVQIFLDNSIKMENYLASEEEIIGFVTNIRDKLIVRKKKQELCNKIYPTVKNIIYKSLLIIQKMQESKKHIFNDEFHPLRFSTQTKIDFLYSLLKTQITDRDLTTLINLLFDFAQSQPHLLAYYFAKYPSLLLKLQKRTKSVYKQNINEMLIPLYLMGYLVLKYMNYTTQWILPELFCVVGKAFKDQSSDTEAKPSLNCRKCLYKYLRLYQNFSLEAWLKNIETIDGNDAMKDLLVPKQPVNPVNQGGFGGLMYFDDEQAQLKLALQMSMRQMEAKNEIPQFEQNNEMEPQIPEQEEESLIKLESTLLKDIIGQCLKQIDYNTNTIDLNCNKVVVMYVVSKIVNSNYVQNADSKGFLYMSEHIKNVVVKLCSQYQNPGNSTIRSILMLWLNLFGNIYSNSNYYKFISESKEVLSVYEEMKQQIIKTLKKIPIQSVNKANVLPNPLARLIKGQKITTNIDFIYGFIQILQPPCEPISSLLLLGCYWLFPKDKQFYTKTKYKDTINEGIRLGKIQKIYDTAINNVEIWKQIQAGDLEWLQRWIEQRKQKWELAMQLLNLYYE